MAEPKHQKPVWYVVGCIGLAILCVPCIGVLAAIAIPSFVSYTRQSKVAEARANLAAIRSGIVTYCEIEHLPGTDPLPRAAPPTLAVPGAEPQMPTIDPAWNDVAFGPTDPERYAYAIERPGPSTAIAVAVGDLDGDGVQSRLSITCELTPPSGCSCGELTVTNELE